MSMSVEERVKTIITKQLGVKENEISADKSFVDDLNADSLDMTELVMAMEEEFGAEIPEERAEGLRTVGDAVNFIKSHQAGPDNGRMQYTLKRNVTAASERFHDSLDELETEIHQAQTVLRRDLALLRADRKKREAAAKEKEAEKVRIIPPLSNGTTSLHAHVPPPPHTHVGANSLLLLRSNLEEAPAFQSHSQLRKLYGDPRGT